VLVAAMMRAMMAASTSETSVNLVFMAQQIRRQQSIYCLAHARHTYVCVSVRVSVCVCVCACLCVRVCLRVRVLVPTYNARVSRNMFS
jgi:hypothetical protein